MASDRNVIQPTVDPVIPLIIRGVPGQTTSLQEWQDASTPLASLSGNGRNLRLASSGGAPALAPGEQASQDGGTDYFIGLTHNLRYFGPMGGSRYDESKEMGALTLESWWNGFLEMNIDMQAPGAGQPFRRPLGFAAAYDGSVCGLAIGSFHSPGAGGVELWGGTSSDVRQLRITERAGAGRNENIFVILRRSRALPARDQPSRRARSREDGDRFAVRGSEAHGRPGGGRAGASRRRVSSGPNRARRAVVAGRFSVKADGCLPG
jgi:hypothetical protein